MTWQLVKLSMKGRGLLQGRLRCSSAANCCFASDGVARSAGNTAGQGFTRCCALMAGGRGSPCMITESPLGPWWLQAAAAAAAATAPAAARAAALLFNVILLQYVLLNDFVESIHAVHLQASNNTRRVGDAGHRSNQPLLPSTAA